MEVLETTKIYEMENDYEKELKKISKFSVSSRIGYVNGCMWFCQG